MTSFAPGREGWGWYCIGVLEEEEEGGHGGGGAGAGAPYGWCIHVGKGSCFSIFLFFFFCTPFFIKKRRAGKGERKSKNKKEIKMEKPKGAGAEVERVPDGAGLPPGKLFCGACRMRIHNQRSPSFLGCGTHFECGQHTIGAKCTFCLCDSCDLSIDSKHVDIHICGCIYHIKCNPGPSPNLEGCLWCEEGVRDPGFFKSVRNGMRVHSNPAKLSASKLARKQPLWGPEWMLGKIFYTAEVWAKAGLRSKFLKEHGFTVSFFRQLGMPPGTFIRAFRCSTPADRFDLDEILAIYPTLTLEIYCTSFDVPWTLGTRPPEEGYPSALASDGVTAAHLLELYRRTGGGCVLEHWAPIEDWQARYDCPPVYSINLQRNMILHSAPTEALPPLTPPPLLNAPPLLTEPVSQQQQQQQQPAPKPPPPRKSKEKWRYVPPNKFDTESDAV